MNYWFVIVYGEFFQNKCFQSIHMLKRMCPKALTKFEKRDVVCAVIVGELENAVEGIKVVDRVRVKWRFVLKQ